MTQRRKRADQPGTRVTLQDVADRAGVSLTTASRVVSGSRVLNDGSRQVGRALADRVRKAVTDLGNTADLQARAVATGRNALVGVIVHDIADPYFSSIAAGVMEVARSRQLLACMSSTPVDRGVLAETAERDFRETSRRV